MIRLAYIAAPSYSGSTLLTFLLNAHPQIATVGELKWGVIDLASYPCSCGALLAECPFWGTVQRELAGYGLECDLQRPPTDFRCRAAPLTDRVARARFRGRAFELARDVLLRQLPESRRSWPRVRATNLHMIQAILRLQGGDVFLDSSKDPVRVRHLARMNVFDLRVVQLVRDGRGTMNSALRHGQAAAVAAAREWRRTHQQIERIAQQEPGIERLVVRYEDLCAAPDKVVGAIHEFVGLPPRPAPADYRAGEHHILGNRMRTQAAREIRLDEKWRARLGSSVLRTFDRVAGSLNERFGYS
jgi:hypothetical protein